MVYFNMIEKCFYNQMLCMLYFKCFKYFLFPSNEQNICHAWIVYKKQKFDIKCKFIPHANTLSFKSEK